MKIKIYKIVIAALFECETWSVVLREEYRLRVSDSEVLRRVHVPGDWRRLHNAKHRDLYMNMCITVTQRLTILSCFITKVVNRT